MQYQYAAPTKLACLNLKIKTRDESSCGNHKSNLFYTNEPMAFLILFPCNQFQRIEREIANTWESHTEVHNKNVEVLLSGKMRTYWELENFPI